MEDEAVVALVAHNPPSGFRSPDSLRPPTASGSRGFIGVSVAMAAIAAGLLWWKLGSAAPSPAGATTPNSPSATSPVVDEAPPPPPPPAPTPIESGRAVEAKPSKRPSGVQSAPGGCAGACKGSVSVELQSALRAKAGAARTCYERALRQNAMLQGRMTVSVRVSPEGNTCGASVVSDGLGDPAVSSCVARVMRSGSLPAPTGGCVDVQVPLSFVSKS